MKRNHGITLIALIITIVVMLILVSVSVSVLVESDLIGAAEKAGNAYKTAVEQEQSLGKITIGGQTYNSLDEYMQSQCSHTYGQETVVEATCIQEGSKTKTCTKCGKIETTTIPTSGHNFASSGTCTVCGATCTHSFVDGTCTVCGATCTHNYVDGECTICGAEKTLPVVTAGARASENSIYSDGTDTAVIPAKFTVSGASTENTIAGGLVIYLIDNKTDEEIAAINWTTDLETLRKTYDQFVWIPIKNVTTEGVQDINDMYICQGKDTTNGACVIEVKNGIAECQTEAHKTLATDEVTYKNTLMAGRLYASSVEDNFEKGFTEVYTEGTGLREPDTVSSYDGKSTNLGYINTILGTNTFSSEANMKKELQSEYNNVVKSVYLNQGFYVGRYETSGMVQSTTGYNIAVVAGVLPSAEVDWYHMYAQQRKYASSNGLTAGSTMIQGAAYDQIMKFVNTSEYNVKQAGEVSHNYYKRYNTGSKSGDVSKNIYDLEGSVWTWTTEALSSVIRIFRGGNYKNTYSASYRYRNQLRSYVGF